MLDYVYYCKACELFVEESESLNEGGYNVCPECLGDTLQRFRRDSIPKELEEEHGMTDAGVEVR